MVKMAEWSKALISRSQSTAVGVGSIPLLNKYFWKYTKGNMAVVAFLDNKIKIRHSICKNKYGLLTWSRWPSGLIRCVQIAVYNCRRGFESRF